MQKKYKKILLEAIGYFFILIGIPSLLLPVLQGVLFILIGLYILSFRFENIEKLFHRIFLKFPKVGKKALFFHNKIKTKLGI